MAPRILCTYIIMEKIKVRLSCRARRIDRVFGLYEVSNRGRMHDRPFLGLYITYKITQLEKRVTKHTTQFEQICIQSWHWSTRWGQRLTLRQPRQLNGK